MRSTWRPQPCAFRSRWSALQEGEWLKEFHGGIDSAQGHGYVVDWGHPLWAWGDRMGSSYQAWVRVRDVEEWAHLKHLTDAEMSAEYWLQSRQVAVANLAQKGGMYSTDNVRKEIRRMSTVERFALTPHFREWNDRTGGFDGGEGDSDGDDSSADVAW